MTSGVAIHSRKQRSTHEDWLTALKTVGDRIPYPVYAAKRDAAVREIRERCAGRRAAYGWSGGKDSQALRIVADLAGIKECVLVICNLEYPAFLEWATEEMPWGLEIVNTGQDLLWLKRHPNMLFPKDAPTAAKWFHGVQHAGQTKYFREHRLDMILMGRRRMDGNFVGRRGETIYTEKTTGVVRYSPLADWTHDDILAAVHWEKLSLPPCYGWPRGFRVGTGPWPARQWTENEQHGWGEVYQIDPSVVKRAAALFPGAETFLHHVGKG